MLIQAEKQLQVRETATGRLVVQTEQKETFLNEALADLDPIGRQIHNGPSNDYWVSLLDSKNGQAITVPFVHLGMIRSASISPNGRLLLSGCDDKNARLWDISGDSRSIEDLVLEAELLTDQRPDEHGNLVLCKPSDWRLSWEKLQAKLPERFAPPSIEQILNWHREELAASEWESNRYACFWHLERLLKAFPDEANLSFRRGLVYEQRGEVGDEKRALSDYSRAIDLHADEYPVYEWRGDLRAGREKWKEALEDYTDAIRLAPTRPRLWQQRAEARIHLRQWKEAIEDCNRAFQLKVRGPELSWNRGVAHAELGHWDEAEADFKDASKHKSHGVATWEMRGWLRLRRGDRAGYRMLCTEALKQWGDTKDVATAEQVAWTCTLAPYAVADFTLPLNLADPVVWRRSEDRNALNTFGAVLYRAGKLQKAIDQLRKSIQIHGKDGDVWDHLFLAMAYKKQGKDNEARRWLAKADDWIQQADQGRLQDPANPLPQSWNARLGAMILRQEAEELLKQPAVPKKP
jgi:tetratricopeptide (TPR) repeat protein